MDEKGLTVKITIEFKSHLNAMNGMKEAIKKAGKTTKMDCWRLIQVEISPFYANELHRVCKEICD